MKIKLLKPYFFSLLACIFFSSCSSNNTSNLTSVWDPIEPINRAVFSFNMAVDTYTLEPVAKVYNYIVPEFLSNSLDGHFNWIKSPGSAINSLLQGKHDDAFLTIANFSINIFTLGFYDLAEDHSNSNKEDFDQTLAMYNFTTGPYIMVPFLGPTTVRGLAGTLADGILDPLNLLGPKKIVEISSAELPIKAVHARSEYMEQINEIKYRSLDSYSVFKSVYFQRLNSQINDAENKDGNITDVNSGAIDAFFIKNQ